MNRSRKLKNSSRPLSATEMSVSATGLNNSCVPLEQEYIKGLQQQVYLLELENNHLRKQASKATEMHPRMTAEAEIMLAKLKDLQSRIDAKELELCRKESNIDSLNENIRSMTGRMQDDSEMHDSEKKIMIDEVVQQRKEKDTLERECSRLQLQIDEIRIDHNKSLAALRSSESKVDSLRVQLESQMDQTRNVELALADKRAELLRVEAQAREAEDKYYTNASRLAEHAKQEMREEGRLLRQKVKELEMAADNDRLMRTKLAEDSSLLVRENATLNQQLVEVQAEIEREKDLRDNLDKERNGELLELAQLREKENALQCENKRLREEVAAEHLRAKRSNTQSAKHEALLSSQQLETNLAQKRLDEAEFSEKQLNECNVKLKKDKSYLLDHVDTLEQRLCAKNEETRHLHEQIDELEARLLELEKLQSLEVSLQSKRWQELEKMASTLKGHARSMSSSRGRQRQAEAEM